MEIRAAEISAILKEQIANFGTEAEVAEVGSRLARWSNSPAASAAWR